MLGNMALNVVATELIFTGLLLPTHTRFAGAAPLGVGQKGAETDAGMSTDHCDTSIGCPLDARLAGGDPGIHRHAQTSASGDAYNDPARSVHRASRRTMTGLYVAPEKSPPTALCAVCVGCGSSSLCDAAPHPCGPLPIHSLASPCGGWTCPASPYLSASAIAAGGL